MGDVLSLARRRPFTATVIVLIVAVYVVEIAQSQPAFWLEGKGDLPDIAALGVVWTPAIGDGEWWRLITASSLHAGLLHIALNCYALVVIGGAAEARFGWWRTAVIFLVAAVGGNIAAAAIQPGAASLGASGGVMGLAGAVVVAAVWSGEGLARSQWVIGAIIATVAFGFINPGISNAAHIGGLIAGGAVSLPLGSTARSRRTQRPAPAPKTQARGTAPGRATATGMNPRQVEFQRRIDAAMAKARAEREEDARRASSGE